MRTQVMKRGSIKAFIRKDQDIAEIEITLQKPDGTLTKIQRKIFRDRPEGKESEWELDGRSVKGGDINKLSASLNINIGNSCHFLPQEMVRLRTLSASQPVFNSDIDIKILFSQVDSP
jgi:chromosome segregation ATPase